MPVDGAESDAKGNDSGPATPYPLRPGISKAWLSVSVTTAHLDAFDDAWESLRAQPEWREWVAGNLAAGPFLCLAVRDDLDTQRLRKIKDGVSMQLPYIRLAEAECEGALVAFFQGVIRDIYQKWAHVDQRPDPPALPSGL